MTAVMESSLAYSRSIEPKLHVVNWGPPAIDLGGGQWGALKILWCLSGLDLTAPEGLALGLLTVALVLLIVVMSYLVVDELGLFFLLLGFLDDLVTRFEVVHVSVLVTHNTFKSLHVFLGFALSKFLLLLKNLSPGTDLMRVVQLNFL